MTNEEKQLLLQDLCARLPYEVKVEVDDYELLGSYTLSGYEYGWFVVEGRHYDIDEVKPYLRPMDDMSEEEKSIMNSLWIKNNELVFADPGEIRRYRFYDISVVDFLNSHHFDYRGLIKRGLALPAPEGMYN